MFLGFSNLAPRTVKASPALPPILAVEINTSGSNLNIRSGPGPNFSVVGTARHTERLVECDRKSGWIQVRNGKHIGWVSDGFAMAVKVERTDLAVDCAGNGLNSIPEKKDGYKKNWSTSNFTSSLRTGLLKHPKFNHRLSSRSNGELLFLGPTLLTLSFIFYWFGRRVKRLTKLRTRVEKDSVHDRLAKVFGFSRYLFYGIFAVSFITFIFLSPPRYHILQSDISKLENNKGEMVAVDLVVEQKAVRLIHIFPLWPTTTRVMMVSKDKKTKWSLKPEAESSYRKRIKPGVLTPRWRLMQGIPEIVWLVFIGWLATQFTSLRRDAIDFAHAIRESDFKAYRNFLNCKGYSSVKKRTKFYRNRAASQVRSRLDRYIIFLEAVTRRAKDAPLRNWFLEVAKSVTGDVPRNVNVSFTRNLAKESWRAQMLGIHKNLQLHLKNASVSSVEEIRSSEERVRRQLEYKNVHDVSEVVNPKFYQALEASITSTLSSIFRYLFSDELISFGGSKGSERLGINYSVRSTTNMFSKTGSDVSELERDWYAGVEFDWILNAFKKSGETGEIKLTTGPKQQIQSAKSNRKHVYIAMCASSFGALGKEFLNNIGLTGDSSEWFAAMKDGKSASLAQDNMETILKKCTEESIEQILTEHKQEITEFVSSLHAHFDAAADQLLNSIVAAGMDLGDFGIDLG